ncbi:hypothetical protein GCM10022214_68360 [Actinomadura miaoliensis]|uniref:Uncharacterized protein n=1 Tax=Actinomadura miaoliensis TaxID=430685 RepID=A0ABP7WS99_9ACTN
MSTDTSLVSVRETHDPRDMLDWQTRDVERVLIDGALTSAMLVNLRRSSPVRTHVASPERLSATAERQQPLLDEHLAAGPDERSWTWLSCADVIVRRFQGPDPRPTRLGELHGRFPGCLIMALTPHGHGHAVVTTVSGWKARLVPVRHGSWVGDDVLSYASAIHAWIVAGRPLDALDTARLTVIRGHAAVRPGVRVMPEDQRGSHSRVG